SVMFVGVFATRTDVPDLVGMAVILDVTLKSSTLDASPFWDFDPSSSTFCGRDPNTGASHFTTSPNRPASGCGDYRDVWTSPGAGSAPAYRHGNTNTLRIGLTLYRQTTVSVTAGEKLFGFAGTIDLSNATEAGGTCSGCSAPVSIDWNGAQATSASGNADDN